MASKDLERVEDETELEMKLGLVPGVLTIAWKKRWKERRLAVVDAAAELSGFTTEAIGERMAEDETLGDVFWTVLDRAGEVGDPEYLDILGRLAAAALDDARLDEVALLAAELTKLEPVHLRVLMSVFDCRKEPVDHDSRPEQVSPVEADWATSSVVSPSWSAPIIGLDEAVLTAAIHRLEAAGFLTEDESHPRSFGPNVTRAERLLQHPQWRPTPWAFRALRLLFPNIGEVGHPSMAGTPLPEID